MYCINYVIRRGDTLYSISRQFGIGLDAIIAANPLVDVYNLMVNGIICIPVSVPSNNYTNYTTYLVEEGDTLGGILEVNGINLADLVQVNNLHEVYIVPGTTLQIPIIEEVESEI